MLDLNLFIGPDNIDTATSYNNVGAALMTMGKYPEAIENFEKALAIRINLLGPDNFEV